MADPQNADPWWSAYPVPRAACPEMTSGELMKLFDDMDVKAGPRHFLLVDVRRTDWEGGTIMTSLNLPAQSFYQSRKTLLDLCDRASIKEVIFYCGECIMEIMAWMHVVTVKGSSSGRGPRCGSWMQDYVDDIRNFGRKSEIKILVLKGGIKGWVKDFEGAMMDEFEEKHWEQFK